MNCTDAEKRLAIRLHELLKAKGELPEIREGDLFDRQNSRGEVGVAHEVMLHFYNDPIYRDNFILFWTWERCREWMRERGWRLSGHRDRAKTIWVSCSFYNYLTLKDEYAEGQTDPECALAVMCQVAEGEKNAKSD